jgi:hypothetical protein
MGRLSWVVAVIVVVLLAAGLGGAQGLHPYSLDDGPPLELGLALAADGSVVYPTRVVPSAASEVVALARLAGKPTGALRATWVAGDVPGRDAGAVLRADDLAPADGHWGVSARLPGPLHAGKYRLNLTADAKPWQSVDFTVADPPKAPDVRRPEDLIPLRAGTTWTYTSTREQAPEPSGKGASPAVTRSRETVTWIARGSDERGTRLERQRDGTPEVEQWWTLSPRGLDLVAVRVPGQAVQPSEPPKLLWAFPRTPSQSWPWRSARNPQEQWAFRAWGPLPVQGLKGATPGYVVLVEWTEKWPEGDVKSSLERHYVPGVGLVREVHIGGTPGPFRLWRNELMLTDFRSP